MQGLWIASYDFCHRFEFSSLPLPKYLFYRKFFKHNTYNLLKRHSGDLIREIQRLWNKIWNNQIPYSPMKKGMFHLDLAWASSVLSSFNILILILDKGVPFKPFFFTSLVLSNVFQYSAYLSCSPFDLRFFILHPLALRSFVPEAFFGTFLTGSLCRIVKKKFG